MYLSLGLKMVIFTMKMFLEKRDMRKKYLKYYKENKMIFYIFYYMALFVALNILGISFYLIVIEFLNYI